MAEARGPAPPLVLAPTALRPGPMLAALFLTIGLVAPLGLLMARAFQGPDGGFVGLTHFAAYVATPSLLVSAWNSVWTAALTTVVVVPLAFLYAYGLIPTRLDTDTCP